MKKSLLALVLALVGTPLLVCAETKPETVVLPMLENEGWWGGLYDGALKVMPYGLRTPNAVMDLRDGIRHQVSAPILVSDKGRWVWSDQAFRMTITNGTMILQPTTTPIQHGRAGKTLREAFKYASQKFMPTQGKMPDRAFFDLPQYNTWIELNYNQNQKAVLEYAANMRKWGFPPGIIMIDDTWQFDYGVWRFDPTVFPSPKEMVDTLHKDGYKVMLWMIQYVSPDTREFRHLKGHRALVRTSGLGFEIDPAPAIFEWWDGLSAGLDFTSPYACKWFVEQLERLQKEYGIDGFKFDGTSPRWYDCPGKRVAAKKDASSGDLSEAYGDICAKFPFNECKAWKGGGKPVVARLNDKPHSWHAVQSLIPEMIAAGLEGYQFVCPDMIGGGQLWSFTHGAPQIKYKMLKPEIYIRSAQVQALCPMMQFSLGPWHILNDTEMAALKKALAIRQKFADKGFFTELAQEAAKTGEPMLRSMEYVFPGLGYAKIVDQFMMGDTLLVAPQINAGGVERNVVIPPGKWLGDDGKVVTGPAEISVKTPLDRIPHFVRQ